MEQQSVSEALLHAAMFVEEKLGVCCAQDTEAGLSAVQQRNCHNRHRCCENDSLLCHRQCRLLLGLGNLDTVEL